MVFVWEGGARPSTRSSCEKWKLSGSSNSDLDHLGVFSKVNLKSEMPALWYCRTGGGDGGSKTEMARQRLSVDSVNARCVTRRWPLTQNLWLISEKDILQTVAFLWFSMWLLGLSGAHWELDYVQLCETQIEDIQLRIWHWHVARTISSQKIFGLYGVKHHIVEISGNVTDAGRRRQTNSEDRATQPIEAGGWVLQFPPNFNCRKEHKTETLILVFSL